LPRLTESDGRDGRGDMRRQSEPAREVTLACAPGIARADVGDISREFRVWKFELWAFLNLVG
jgi:hypothetical protein